MNYTCGQLKISVEKRLGKRTLGRRRKTWTEVDRTGSGLYPTATFSTSGVEPSSYTRRILI